MIVNEIMLYYNSTFSEKIRMADSMHPDVEESGYDSGACRFLV